MDNKMFCIKKGFYINVNYIKSVSFYEHWTYIKIDGYEANLYYNVNDYDETSREFSTKNRQLKELLGIPLYD